MNIVQRKTVMKTMDFSLYCYNFFLHRFMLSVELLLWCEKGLSVLFDEQDIKIYLKIIEICLILRAITKLDKCDSMRGAV